MLTSSKFAAHLERFDSSSDARTATTTTPPPTTSAVVNDDDGYTTFAASDYNNIGGSDYSSHNNHGSCSNNTNNSYNNKNNKTLFTNQRDFLVDADDNVAVEEDEEEEVEVASMLKNRNLVGNNTTSTTTTTTNNNNNSDYTHTMNNNENHNFSFDAEQTMDVPLLSHNGNNNNYNDCDDHEMQLQQQRHQQEQRSCRCRQPGFGVNLMDKTAKEAKFKILLAISLCVIFMIIEFLGGYLAGSLAIVTDAAHLASDCVSFVIGLISIWLGGRPPDARMSFGYKRTEVMGALISICSIWILTATLVLAALERLLSDDYELDGETMMIISGIGIVINVIMAKILHGSSILPPGGAHSHTHAHSHAHSHSHGVHLTADCSDDSASEPQHAHDRAEKNLNLRAAMIHVIGDLVQSIGIFLAAIFIHFFPSAKFMDPLCTLLFSVIVLLTTVGLFKESACIIADAVPREVSTADLRMDLANIEGVQSVHHLNVWKHTTNFNVMMVHLVVDSLIDGEAVLHKATTLASSHKYRIKHSTIQIERPSSYYSAV